MKKLFINSTGNVILKDVKTPIIETKGALIRTSFALISTGTELLIIKGRKLEGLPLYKKITKSKEYRKLILSKIKNKNLKTIFQLFRNYKKRGINKNFISPSLNNFFKPLGYSCSGIISDSNCEDFKINDKVSCAGINHAQIIFAPNNLLSKIPDGVSLEEASFATLGAIAIHGIHRAEIKQGEYVGIIGTGLIGLITIQLAKISGATVVAIDLINKRLNLAKELGANFLVNPLYHNLNFKINDITKGKGLDSIIICASSNNSKPLNDAIDIIRDKGKIIMVGGFPIDIDRGKLYNKEADLFISRSYGPGRYDPYYEYKGYDYPEKYIPFTEQRNMNLFLKLISEKKINILPLISEIIPVENANLAYNKLEKDPINNIAILLDFNEKKENFKQKHTIKKEVIRKEKLIIGLIGCGSFPQSMHLPHLISNSSCQIKGICTEHQNSAEICEKKYRSEYVTTDYKKIIKDPEIETIFIYTRHNTHEKFSIEALKAGKNVFVEKPMGISVEQCINVFNTVKETNQLYLIGFNRRYSPLIKIAKELIDLRKNPIVINYRISSLFLSGTHWIFDPNIGGGPLIGEFCHFTDLILFLMNSKPLQLYALGGNISHKNLNIYDSCTVVIKFKDGSIANIIYNDLNGPNMPKERIEIFTGESSIIINDFKKIKTSGFDFGNKYLYEQDKGHKNEIDSIIDVFLEKKKPLVNEDDALRAMDICFKTIESIKSNKIINFEKEI